MSQDAVRYSLDLSHEEILKHLLDISSRQFPEPGHRQVPFTVLETLLCYGLFYILDPHHYGGANINTLPAAAKKLATFFRRTPGSITNKMLNLDGSRPHSSHGEPLLFAYLAWEPTLYPLLYRDILKAARDLSIDEETLPDFLGYLSSKRLNEDLLGQEDLPNSTAHLLAGNDNELQNIEQAFLFNERQTERFAERKVRLAQHRFALAVLENCGRACVFCGFAPNSLPIRSGLLRASHIKPWSVSDQRERVDVRNGLAACPMHDAAFDQGYLTVNSGNRIHRAGVLQESLAHHDNGVALYFGAAIGTILLLPQHAAMPAPRYLDYHRENIFKG
jgi:putative restriction endonuclease